MGLTPGSWTAYQFDLSTLLAGRTVERRLDDGQSIAQALGEQVEAPRDLRSARELAGGPVRKVALPESGVW